MPGGLQRDFRISFGFEPWYELFKVAFQKGQSPVIRSAEPVKG